MTTGLTPDTPSFPLRVQRRGDLLLDFRNRDLDLPLDPDAFIDYPAGTVGVLTIETTPPIERTSPTSGHHCIVWLAAEQADTLKRELWSFRLRYPDDRFPDGYFDKVVVNGVIEREDGKQ